MKSIKQVEEKLQQLLGVPLQSVGLLPKDFTVQVRLHVPNKKKKELADFNKNFVPEHDSVHITFAPKIAVQQDPDDIGNASNPTVDLLQALDRAEAREDYSFVSLKWFRDTLLVNEQFNWATDACMRRKVLGDSINRRLVLVSKVPNVLPSDFPVTAIHLNRDHPQVREAVGHGFVSNKRAQEYEHGH